MPWDNPSLLSNIGIVLVTATVFLFLGRLIKMPSIVVYIIAGLFLGPLLGIVTADDGLALMRKIGIVLLLFLVGLELSIPKIKDVGKVAVAAGLGQVVFTAVGGLLICWLLGFGWMESIFLAVALTFSSTVVVVKLLDQKGDINALYGRIAVGIFLVQDIVVIIVMTFLSGLGRGEEMNFGDISLGLLSAFGGMALLLVVVLVASRYILPKPFRWIARSPDAIMIWALAWCFLIVLLAMQLRLEIEIGAFLAGLALAQLPFNDDLRRRIHPLMNFFIAVFFVTLGIEMELSEAAAEWKASIGLSLFVLIGNPLIFMIIIAAMKYGEQTAFNTSVTVAQISEFSFIFVAMGVTAGLIGSEIMSITALVGIITISVSSYLILYSAPIYRFVRRTGLLKIFRARPEEPESKPTHTAFENHIIVIGMNALGRMVVRKLHEKGETVVAVDTDMEKLSGLPGVPILGNVEFDEVVEEIGLAHAKLVISALHIEDANLLLTYRCKSANVPCAIHAFDVSVIPDLLELEADYLMLPGVEGVVEQRRILEESGLVKP